MMLFSVSSFLASFTCFPSRFVDIGANLTDEMFNGIYNGSKKHDPDRSQVLDRAWHVGVEKIIITVGTIFDCEPAFKIAATDGEQRHLCAP